VSKLQSTGAIMNNSATYWWNRGWDDARDGFAMDLPDIAPDLFSAYVAGYNAREAENQA